MGVGTSYLHSLILSSMTGCKPASSNLATGWILVSDSKVTLISAILMEAISILTCIGRIWEGTTHLENSVPLSILCSSPKSIRSSSLCSGPTSPYSSDHSYLMALAAQEGMSSAVPSSAAGAVRWVLLAALYVS